MATPTETARATLGRAARHLLDLQDEQGWWQGELETNVSIEAEDLLLREFLGIRTAELTDATARWIRSRQRSDGTWSNSYNGKPELSSTIEAYVALRLAGDPPDAYHMAQAAGWIRNRGRHPRHPGVHPDLAGPVRRVVLGRPAGHAARADLPAQLVPAERLDWACWARQTIVPLTIVGSLQPGPPASVRAERAARPGRDTEDNRID